MSDRFFVAIAVLCLAQVALSVSGPGETILAPTTGGNAAAGVTILSGPAPSNVVATPPAGYKSAIVIHPKSDCGCQQEAVCPCAQPEYVEPEIKVDPPKCGCAGEVACGCAPMATVEPETVAPEQKVSRVEPELADKLNHATPCTTCQQLGQPEFVAPELKPECECASLVTDCGCKKLPSN